MVFFPLQLPKHSKKKTEQSPAGPECPCQGGSRLCSTAAGSSWDAPGQSGPQSHCSQQRLWGRAVQELRFGHHKMSPHIAKLICTEVYPRAPFPFLCKENTIQPRQLSWLQRGVHSIPGDPAESLGTQLPSHSPHSYSAFPPAGLKQLQVHSTTFPSKPRGCHCPVPAPTALRNREGAEQPSAPNTQHHHSTTTLQHRLGTGIKHLGEET